MLGIGLTTVLRILTRNGVERVGLQEYRKTMGDPSKGPYIGVYSGPCEEIVDWYASGISMKDIAKKINRSVHVVVRILRNAGVASRPWASGGTKHSMWIGGRILDFQGYWKQWIPEDDTMVSMRNKNGYVKEHRLILARKIGRSLLPTETVHHINGCKTNNTPSNLELRQGHHGKHVVMCCLNCGSRNVGHIAIGNQ